MLTENKALHLPAYQMFIDTISVLELPISGSELHGIMCGYLCAGAPTEGEAYLRALTVKSKKMKQRVPLLWQCLMFFN